MRIGIMGYYGMGNIGDEAILSVMIHRLRSENPNVKIIVFSADPISTKNLHSVEAQNSPSLTKPSTVIKFVFSLLKIEKLIIGGGGFLCGESFGRTLTWVLLAKWMKRKVEFYAVGIQPKLQSQVLGLNLKLSAPVGLRSRLLAPLVLNHIDAISVRDEFSKECIRKAGFKKDIEVIEDPAIYLEPVEPEVARKYLEERGIKRDNYLIGLSLRYIPDREICYRIKEVISKIVDWLAEVYGAKIIFIPFCRSKILNFDDDYKFAMELKKEVANKENFIILDLLKPRETKGVIGQLDFLIGMRLHSLIFASSFGIPLIGLIYAPKVKSFLEKIGQPGIPIDKLNFDILKQLIEERITLKKRAGQG